MLPGAVEAPRGAGAADLDIGGLVGADRRVVARNIRNSGERLMQLRLGGLQGLLLARHAFLDARDLGLDLLGLGLVALAHRLADLLGGGVAAFLESLKPGNQAAAGIVEGDQARSLSGQPALGEPLVEGFRVVADQFDVVHGDSYGRRML